MAFKNLLESIGNTPLVKVPFDVPATVLAKLEYLNPGGSLKDRSALYMIEQAEKDGRLKPGGTIIDASSGNHGIAVSMIGAMKGYKVIICVSEKISQEKLQTLQAYGTHVVMCKPTDRLEDPASYHSVATRLHQETPNSFMPNQYFDVANARGHYHSLGPEIWQQTEGKVTHLFAATGTAGHLSGAGRYLKEQNPNIKTISLDSNNSWRATGGHPKPYRVEGMGIDFDSPVFDHSAIDQIITVTDDDALSMLKVMARRYGLLLGPSSGAVAHAVYEYAQGCSKDDVIVMVFGDSGRAYLTKDFYTEKDHTTSHLTTVKNNRTVQLP